MGKNMKNKQKHKSFKEKLAEARRHAFAVLQDKGKLLPGAEINRIKTSTMTIMLGMTYTNGRELQASSYEAALIHWDRTGFLVYTPDLEKQTSKQQKWSDAYLMRTATAEAMKYRRQQYFKSDKGAQ